MVETVRLLHIVVDPLIGFVVGNSPLVSSFVVWSQFGSPLSFCKLCDEFFLYGSTPILEISQTQTHVFLQIIHVFSCVFF